MENKLILKVNKDNTDISGLGDNLNIVEITK